MPSIRKKGCRITVFTNDHRPSHVHVFCQGSEVVCNLRKGERTVEIREIVGSISTNDVRKAVAVVRANFDRLIAMWERCHGDAD